MTSGQLDASGSGNLKISSGIVGKAAINGRFYVSQTEYVLQVSSLGESPFSETYMKLGVSQ